MHVLLTLTSSRAALPRVVSVIHGKGWRIVHLHADGGSVCLLLEGADDRAASVLSRVVDVVVVTTDNEEGAARRCGRPSRRSVSALC